MKLMKSKKGFWFLTFLFIIVFISMIYAYDAVVKTTTVPSYTLGDEAVLLIDQIQKSEKLMYYQERSAKIAGEKSIFEYAKNGGNIDGCGMYKGVPLWNNNYDECFPIKSGMFNESYRKYFDSYFNTMLNNFPGTEMKNPYIIFYDENEKMHIVGIAKDTKRLNLNDNSKSELGMNLYSSNLAPSTLDQIQVGEIISFISEETGLKEDWEKIGVINGEVYYFNIADIQKLQPYVVDPHLSEELTKDNLVKKIPEEKWVSLIEKFSDSFSKTKKMALRSSMPLDIEYLELNFVNKKDEPDPNELIKGSQVYYHDVWEAAQNADVNYYLLLSIGAQESGQYKFNKNDVGAHGVMQMFTPSTKDVFQFYKNDLKKLFPLKMKDINTQEDAAKIVYGEYFIDDTWERENVKIQLQFGAYYIQIVQRYLAASKSSPPINIKTVIQAYHDGHSYIIGNGDTTFCTKNPGSPCEESKTYFGYVNSYYNKLAIT